MPVSLQSMPGRPTALFAHRLISSEKLVKALTFEQINSIEIILNYEKPIEAPINKNQ